MSTIRERHAAYPKTHFSKIRHDRNPRSYGAVTPGIINSTSARDSCVDALDTDYTSGSLQVVNGAGIELSLCHRSLMIMGRNNSCQ